MIYNAVSFPGLGIGQIKLNPEINITDNFSIHWYAIIICIGMIVAYFVCNYLRKQFKIKEDDFLDCIIYAIPIGFIGARITYVLGDLESFHSFMDVIAIWNGGIAIYGGIIFSALTVFTVCKIKKCDPFQMFDVMAIGLLIGQIIGRWGNFINIEVYGVQTTLPWAMGLGTYGNGADVLVHPLFLYESLWNLIGFILIYGYRNLRSFNGEMFLWYTAWYGLGRGLMEPLRDSEFNLHIFGVRIMMVVAFTAFVLSVLAVIYLRIRNKKCRVGAEKTDEGYVNQFETETDEETEVTDESDN